MNIIKKRFTNMNTMEKFWNVDAPYEFADIMQALEDRGLMSEQLYFALHFYEPDVKAFYNLFEIDFVYIKDALGIPEEYVDRNQAIDTIEAIKQVKTDPSKLAFDKEEMKERFAKLMKMFATESKEAAIKLEKEVNTAVQNGEISKSAIKPRNVEYKLDEMLKEFESKK